MKCPGQDTQFWKQGSIYEVECSKCGKAVEFFKDDATRKCSCGHRFENPRVDLDCMSYCKFAEECLRTFPPDTVEERKKLLKKLKET